MIEGVCMYYGQGVMERVYAKRVIQGLCPPNWQGRLAASLECDRIGTTIRASIQNPHTLQWSAFAEYLLVDCSQTADRQRHIDEGLILEVAYDVAEENGFLDEGKAKVQVLDMAVTAATRPNFIDITGLIQHVRTETERTRALSEIQHQVAHYQAGAHVSANMTQAQEIAYAQGLAHYHQTQHDFGGGVHGRTLEYTNLVFPSGRLYLANRETLVTWSHKEGNRVGMSTLFVLGSGQEPTQAMLDTGKQLFDYTVSRTDMRVAKQRTWGHGETSLIYGGGPAWGNNTDCPGKMLAWVRAYRQEVIPVPDPIPVPGPKNPDANGYFEATGFSINPPGLSAIGDYWRANGGVAEFGYPVSNEGAGTSEPYSALPELAGYQCQLFERGLLHWRAGQPVGVGRVGALAMALLNSHGCACD